MSGTTLFIAALTLLTAVITTLGTVVVAKINSSVKAVHDEIRTNDGQRAGDYIEATAKRLVVVELAAAVAEGTALALRERVTRQELRIDDINRDITRVGHLLGGHLVDVGAHRDYGLDADA